MSDINISIPNDGSKRLLTGGKYCPDDIVVTAQAVQSDNLFNIDLLNLAWRQSKDGYAPKVEDGVFYSGGKSGISAGAYAYVFVEPGDMIKFSANVSGQEGRIEVRAFPIPSNSVFDTSTQLESFLIANDGFEKIFSIPEGCYCFGFAAYGASRYVMAITDISITKEVSESAEQAVAYSILMGDAV